MSAFNVARLTAKAKVQTRMLMVRYSAVLSESENRLMDGNR